MEAHRATDNVQQKASDCLGTENEKPYDIGQRIIDQNQKFTRFRGDLSLAQVLESLERLRANPINFEPGGIINRPGHAEPILPDEEKIFLNGVYLGVSDVISVDMTDPDFWIKIQNWKRGRSIIVKNDNPKKD